MAQTPKVHVENVRGIPRHVFAPFESDLAEAGFQLERTERSDIVYASAFALIPPAIAVVIAHIYLKALFTEAGKEHYRLLSDALKAFARKVCLRSDGADAVSASLPANAATVARASAALGLSVEFKNAIIRLALVPDTDPALAVVRFLDLVALLHAQEEQNDGDPDARLTGVYVVRYDPDSDSMVFMTRRPAFPATATPQA